MNLRKLRIGILIYAAFDLFIGGVCGGFLPLSQLAAAQFTTVSGTVTDPNSVPYSNGTITAVLVSSSTPKFTGTNFPYTPPTQPVGLSAAGSFVMQLADNTQLTPGGTTWSFTVCSGAGSVSPAIGKGPICFTVTGVTISGASQSITATLVAAAPALTLVIGGGGSGTVSSGTATQIAFYSAGGTTVVSNPRLTDNGTVLGYTGTGGINAGTGGVQTTGTVTGGAGNFTGTVAGNIFQWNANVAAYNFFGNCTGSSATPSMCPIPAAALPNTLALVGTNTTGTIPKFTTTGLPGTIGNSLLADNGSTLSYSGGGGLAVTGGNVTVSSCTAGQFLKGDGTGCGPGPGPGFTTYASAFANLAAALTGVGGAGIVWNDTPQTLAASSLNINSSNLTLACTSPLASISFPAGARMRFANGGNARNFTVQNCNFKGPDMATGSGAFIAFGENGDATGLRFIGNSINGFGSTSRLGIVSILNASHVQVSQNRAGDQAVGSSITVSTASWNSPQSYTDTGVNCSRTASSTAVCTAGSPATWGTPFTNASTVQAIQVVGCSGADAAQFNGNWNVSNAAAGTATLNFVSAQSTTDSVTGCTVYWNSLLGLEQITATASLPTDFVAGNAILCSGMVPAGFNQPGDGSSTYFGQIFSVSGTTFFVEQIFNPGTYTSGGTCSAGVGNGDRDIQLNSTLPFVSLTDWNVDHNDVGAIGIYTSIQNAMAGGIKFDSNDLHPGLSSGYYWGVEWGALQGTSAATPFALHDISETGNKCTIVGDYAQGFQMAGCFSQGTTQDLSETGQKGYSGGHQYSTQMDENGAAQNVSSTGGVWNMLGGGSGEDINRSNHDAISNTVFLYPGPTSNFVLHGVASGGGSQNIAQASYNNVSNNVFIARSEICPQSAGDNSCGAQIASISQAAGTATVTFSAGVVDPRLFVGAIVNVSGNQTTGGCAGSTFNANQTVVSVVGAGTGFTFSNSSVAGPCTGGVAVGPGTSNPAGNTDVIAFSICPHPIHVGDLLGVTNVGVTGYNTATPTVTNVTAITELPPCTVTYSLNSGLSVSGGGFASNYNGRFVQAQLNLTSGASMDHNVYQGNEFIGGGATMGGEIAFNLSDNLVNGGVGTVTVSGGSVVLTSGPGFPQSLAKNNIVINGTSCLVQSVLNSGNLTLATTGTCTGVGVPAAWEGMDGNQLVQNKIQDVSQPYVFSGSASMAPTNTKVEMGETFGYTTLLTQNNLPTYVDGGTNPATIQWSGTGTATASSSLYLYPNCGTTLCQPLTTLTATVEGGWYVAQHNYTVSDFACTAGTAGVAGDLVTIRINKVNKGIYNCSLAAATACAVSPATPATGNAGDVISSQATSGAADTLANVICKAHIWYGN